VTLDRPRVLVVADDLIWSTRLVDHLRAAGAEPIVVRAPAAAEAGPDARAAVVDLTARAYDGVAVIEANRAAGRAVLAVGQHDDLELRKRALAAGADRVLAYRKLFEDGPATLRTWLDGITRSAEESITR
jgi:DNA-binding response OmpR family regulator